MVTGFYPEPNYILASTASIAFLTVAAVAHWLFAWHHHVPLSFAIALSSIWFHTQRSYTAYLVDQTMILVWGCAVFYEAWLRGGIPLGIGTLGGLYIVLIFYGGYLGQCYAFDPDRQWSTFYHALVHIVSFGSSVGILLLAPSPALSTVKFVASRQ